MLDQKTPVGPELEPPQSRRLIGISLLPASATLGNLLCGFLAIYCCLLSVRAEYAQQYYRVQPRVFLARFEQVFPTHVAAGAYLIVLALFFDALDGRLARLTRRTSEFGAQLDSLSDIVSFGVAPAALVITLLLRPVSGELLEEADATRLQRQVGMFCALVYVSCAAIRLARFNAENVKSESGQQAFSGLPSPGAAAAVAAMLALHEHVRQSGFASWGIEWAGIVLWGTLLTAFAVGLLMVSRLDYVHVFNVYVRRKRPPTHLVWLIVFVGLGWYSFELLLVAVAFTYVASGVVVNLFRRRKGEAGAAPREK